MINIPTEVLDAACAAYYRSTGSAPNRAGLRSALHTVNQLSDQDRELVRCAISLCKFENYDAEAEALSRLLGLSGE